MLVAVVALVVVAGAVAGTVRALAGNPDQPTVPAADDGRPGDVLLVPGYGGSTTALDALAGRIAAAGGSGFHATVIRLAGDGTGDLQVQANVLNGYVNQALASGSGPVTVIGYSAGGVVAWLWDVEYNGLAKARRIITLGSPLHGADLAAVGAADAPDACPQACEELVPGSSMLHRLQGTGSAPRPPRPIAVRFRPWAAAPAGNSHAYSFEFHDVRRPGCGFSFDRATSVTPTPPSTWLA